MAIVGERPKHTMGARSYSKDPLYNFAKQYNEEAQAILSETSHSLYEEPQRCFRQRNIKDDLMRAYLENCYDQEDCTLSADDRRDILEGYEAQFENDVEAIQEHAVLPEYNPIVGMSLPVHKFILMNNVFDKGAIQKVTAVAPKFTITMERRYLITTKGEEIDMFLDQNKMTEAINETAPWTKIRMDLPETGATDILQKLNGTAGLDNLVLSTFISAVNVGEVVYEKGDILPNKDGFVEEGGEVATAQVTKDTWVAVHLDFAPMYGNKIDRVLMTPVTLTVKALDGEKVVVKHIDDTISANIQKNKFTAVAMLGNIKKVELCTRLDMSNGAHETCSVAWKQSTDLVEIDTAMPINTTITPEEVKDLSAEYNVSQVTKLMSLYKTVLANYKDDTILQGLNDNYKTLSDRDKSYNTFDFAPESGYALDYVEWRHKTFMDFLDSEVTHLLQALNDPNVTIAVFGDPDLIRKITPKEYTYQAPSNIGPVELTYSQTIVNASDNRVYNFLGSDKLRGSDDLIIILNPRNSDRIIYRIYDYQMYVSNEIRNAKNPTLPALHAFERFLFKPYQAVQGRVKILNRSGRRA